MAQERARRQLPTLAYDVLHCHGRIPPAILSRTEVRMPNSVAEDAAELHEGAQGERAPRQGRATKRNEMNCRLSKSYWTPPTTGGT